MSIGEVARSFLLPVPRIQVPAGASPQILELLAALNGQRVTFTERGILKAIEVPFEQLKKAPVEDRTALVFEALTMLGTPSNVLLHLLLKGVVSQLLRGGLPINSLQALRMIELVSKQPHRFNFPYKAVLSAIDGLPMTPAMKDALLRLKDMVGDRHGFAEIQGRIEVMVHGEKEKPVEAVSGWSRNVFQEVDRSDKQMAWRRFLLHARSLTQTNPGEKWKKESLACVDKIGRQEFLEASRRWLALGPMPEMQAQLQVPDDEADYQKGFIWTLGVLGEASLAAGVADFALACFRKIPQIGAVSHRVGNACVNALAAMPGLDAVTQISRLSVRVKYDVARRLIEKALAEAAERNHVSRDDLEAMAVPTYGLNAGGIRTEVLGSCEARLSLEDGCVSLTFGRDGKSLKSAPADVKTSHAAALTDLKKAAKEMQAVLDAQRLRLERQLLYQSSSLFERWKEWYLHHPLTATLAKRLIWEIQTGQTSQTAMWWQDRLVDWAGNPVTATADSLVRLWHPIHASVQDVLSWRCWLVDRGIVQPFKQAHREVYLLTDAERETNTYSNRFAGHIVRQHQFSALCRERGWQFNLMGEWDSHNTPRLELARCGFRAEFDVDFLDDADVSGHMVYTTIASARVQFFPIEAKPRRFDPRSLRGPFRRAIPLTDIPAVVFSEVMRDADLMVGVTSIGTDPNWPAEHHGEHAEYWHRFADGDLSSVAENRRSVLESLLPKLAIKDRCRIADRYLIVRGESNEYRIHIGSGNVMMEPGSRYLCIVRGAGDTSATVPLPFEGDATLAIILSKAFLLANDKTIKDETILRQIRTP